jgi:hypothetical protein
MQGFIASGHAVDFVLAVLALEACVLLLRSAPTERRRRAIDVVCAFAPGACLLLALRASLTGLDWPWIALFIAASFPFHLADLRRRRL